MKHKTMKVKALIGYGNIEKGRDYDLILFVNEEMSAYTHRHYDGQLLHLDEERLFNIFGEKQIICNLI